MNFTNNKILLKNRPFGMAMGNRKFMQGSSKYRYSINAQEKETDLNENITTAEFWEYDSRIGRRWNVDPKPNISISPYNCFAGNPIFYPDMKGDSIPVKFLNQSNNLQEDYLAGIPDKVQQMFNKEYGIKVGYNAETQMLYYDGEIETSNKVSPTAKGKLVSILSATDSKKKSLKNFGELIFGYDGLKTKEGNEVEHGMQGSGKTIRVFGKAPVRHTVYTNLDAFNEDFTVKGFDYSGLTSKGFSYRTFNMARWFEHEFFGHGIDKRDDPPRGQFTAGKVELLPNLFRTEMGLPMRSNYGVNTGKGLVVIFGATAAEVKAAVYDYKKIENLPYVIKSIIK